MIRTFLYAFTLLLVLGKLNAKEFQETITEYHLDNELHIVVVENHRAPIVDFLLVYHVGAVDEKPGKSGLAHYVEHLMFKGTQQYGPGEYDQIIKSLGGSNNAYTTQEYTAYDVRVYKEHLERVMELEADRMINATFAPEISLTERDVVIEERLQRYDSNPNSLFAEQLNAALYQNHPYGIPVIGWLHEIESLSLDDVKEFYQEYYQPNNATLIVGGDVEPEEVLSLAMQYFGNIEGSPLSKTRPNLIEPPQRAPRLVKMADPRISTPYVYRKYLVPNEFSSQEENLAAIAIMTDLLGGRDLSSALSEQLELTNFATYSAAGYTGDIQRPVVINIYVVPSDGYSLEETEAKLDEVLANFAKGEVNKDHLERIKSDVRFSSIYDRDDIDSTVFKYGAGLATGLTLEQIQTWDEKLMNVEAEHVTNAAQLLLDKNLTVTGWLMSEESVE